MSNLQATDPLSLLESWLWWIIRSSPEVAALVRPGNFIRYDGEDPHPDKERNLSSDFPILGMVPVGGQIGQQRTSSTVDLTQRWQIGVFTDEQRTAGDRHRRAGMNQLKWALYKAFERWVDVGPLPFKVTVARLGTVIDRLGVEKGPEGWNALLDLEVRVDLPRIEVAA